MELKNIKPGIRHLEDMKELLFDKEWAKSAPDKELYYMYRDLAENKEDKKKISEANLRYDITIMPYLLLGKEFNKTAGHDHPFTPNSQMTYPEIYEVLSGRAIFLIQDSYEDEIKDIAAIKAEQGKKVIIPPNYEHLIINISGKELKTANWICRSFDSNIYKPFKQKHGFAYFAIQDEEKQIEWLENDNYKKIPPLRFIQANLWLDKFKIDPLEKMYQLVEDLSKLDFLKNPQNYIWQTLAP